MTLKMRILSGSFSSILLLAILSTARGAPLTLECPAKYPDITQMQALATKGWRAPFLGAPNAPLEEVGVSLGPAEENGRLQGDPLQAGTGERFHFHGLKGELEKWVFCGYHIPSGYARLMYQVPIEGRRCETRLKRSRGRLVAARIWCD